MEKNIRKGGIDMGKEKVLYRTLYSYDDSSGKKELLTIDIVNGEGHILESISGRKIRRIERQIKLNKKEI
jgi:hypothetical protein